eukprot:233496-Pelagomonas_calceolata.AAC.1
MAICLQLRAGSALVGRYSVVPSSLEHAERTLPCALEGKRSFNLKAFSSFTVSASVCSNVPAPGLLVQRCG